MNENWVLDERNSAGESQDVSVLITFEQAGDAILHGYSIRLSPTVKVLRTTVIE